MSGTHFPDAESEVGSADLSKNREGGDSRYGSFPLAVEELAGRVNRLDDRRQRALLRILDDLENGDMPSASFSPDARCGRGQGGSENLRIDSEPGPALPQVEPLLGTDTHSTPKFGVSLKLRVLSNWGDPRQAGLTQMQALDRNGEVLRIAPASMSVKGVNSGATSLSRLLDGHVWTTNEKQMWVGTVTPDDLTGGFEPFELLLSWPEQHPPAALRIWNFNAAGGRALSKGVRAVELHLDGKIKWKGEVSKGTGRERWHPTTIPIDAHFAPPPCDRPQEEHPDDQESETLPRDPSMPIWLQGSGGAVSSTSGPRFGNVAEDCGISPEAKRHRDRMCQEDKELMASFEAIQNFNTSCSRGRFFPRRGRALEEVDGYPQDSLQVRSAEDIRRIANFGIDPGGPAVTSPDENGVPEEPYVASLLTSGSLEVPKRSARHAELEQRWRDMDDSRVTAGEGAYNDKADTPQETPWGRFEGDALEELLRAPDDEEDRPDTAIGVSLAAASLDESMSLTIPTLPRGRMLVFNCVSTWGDNSFVGLAGIEIFDDGGFPVVLNDAKRQVTADPPNINVLQEYCRDPRTVDKLFDQVNFTRDDLHTWLAPFEAGRSHTVTVDLEIPASLSMIRVWNYNKSRLHSSRGVRDLEILFDGVPIFVGEIRQAPGLLSKPEEACEHILFTYDEAVLNAMEEHDWLPAHIPLEREFEDERTEEGCRLAADKMLGDDLGARPHTADTESSRPSVYGRAADARCNPDYDPIALVPVPSGVGADGRPITAACLERRSGSGVACSAVTLVLHSSWGDAFYIGVTELQPVEVVDEELQPIRLLPEQLSADPRDLNELEHNEVQDDRTLDKIQDGVGCTVDDQHMWLAPFVSASRQVAIAQGLRLEDGQPSQNLIRIEFGRQRTLMGFNVWNYNKNYEDSCRGVKEFSVYCDERYVGTYVCRKAPGHARFDFKQLILLNQPPRTSATLRDLDLPATAPKLPARENSMNLSRGDLPAGYPRIGGVTSCMPAGSSLANLRSGPGTVSGNTSRMLPRPLQQYETPVHPCGFVFKLVLRSTWSDVHYIGLDGVELYDRQGAVLRPKEVHSNHKSVRLLPGMEQDVRTEKNLMEGNPLDSGRMWLAPFVRSPPNTLELVFDVPAELAAIRFWNYSRTPSRGAQEIEVYVDDLLIYQGVLRMAAAGGSVGLQSGALKLSDHGESVLFTADAPLVEREGPLIYLPTEDELITFFDERQQVDRLGGSRGFQEVEERERPRTALLA